MSQDAEIVRLKSENERLKAALMSLTKTASANLPVIEQAMRLALEVLDAQADSVTTSAHEDREFAIAKQREAEAQVEALTQELAAEREKHDEEAYNDMRAAKEAAEASVTRLTAEREQDESDLTALRASVPQWLPIETAPIGNYAFLAWDPTHDTMRIVVQHPVGTFELFPEGRQWTMKPTAWMPLPAPPTPEGSTGLSSRPAEGIAQQEQKD